MRVPILYIGIENESKMDEEKFFRSVEVFWSKDDSMMSHSSLVKVPGLDEFGNRRTRQKVKGKKTKEVKTSVSSQRVRVEELPVKKQQNKKNVVKRKSEEDVGRCTNSLKDLCAEDKKRVANLIRELARVGDEKENLTKQLKEERVQFEHQFRDFSEQQESILKDRESVQEQLFKCQRLLSYYQQQSGDYNEKRSSEIRQTQTPYSHEVLKFEPERRPSVELYTPDKTSTTQIDQSTKYLDLPKPDLSGHYYPAQNIPNQARSAQQGQDDIPATQSRELYAVPPAYANDNPGNVAGPLGMPMQHRHDVTAETRNDPMTSRVNQPQETGQVKGDVARRASHYNSGTISPSQRPFTQMIDRMLAEENSEGHVMRGDGSNGRVMKEFPGGRNASAGRVTDDGPRVKPGYSLGPLNPPVMSSTQRSDQTGAGVLPSPGRSRQVETGVPPNTVETHQVEQAVLYSTDGCHQIEPRDMSSRQRVEEVDTIDQADLFNRKFHPLVPSSSPSCSIQSPSGSESQLGEPQDSFNPLPEKQAQAMPDLVTYYQQLTPHERKRELMAQKEALLVEQTRLQAILAEQELLLKSRQEQLHQHQRLQRQRLEYFEEKGHFPAEGADNQPPRQVPSGEETSSDSSQHAFLRQVPSGDGAASDSEKQAKQMAKVEEKKDMSLSKEIPGEVTRSASSDVRSAGTSPARPHTKETSTSPLRLSLSRHVTGHKENQTPKGRSEGRTSQLRQITYGIPDTSVTQSVPRQPRSEPNGFAMEHKRTSLPDIANDNRAASLLDIVNEVESEQSLLSDSAGVCTVAPPTQNRGPHPVLSPRQYGGLDAVLSPRQIRGLHGVPPPAQHNIINNVYRKQRNINQFQTNSALDDNKLLQELFFQNN